MIAIRSVRQRPCLIDDQIRRCIRSDIYLRDVPAGIQAPRSKRITVDERRFDSRYRVTFNRHNLEEHILDDP